MHFYSFFTLLDRYLLIIFLEFGQWLSLIIWVTILNLCIWSSSNSTHMIYVFLAWDVSSISSSLLWFIFQFLFSFFDFKYLQTMINSIWKKHRTQVAKMFHNSRESLWTKRRFSATVQLGSETNLKRKSIEKF